MTQTAPMTRKRKRELASRFGPTVQKIMACVYWTKSRCTLIHRSQHGWRKYIRVRVWQRHRVKHVWYPSKRSFVVPLDRAEEIGEAILRAADGLAEDKPDWLIRHEEVETAEKRPERERV